MSGLKTAVLRYVKQERAAGRDLHLPDLAASFQEAIVDVQVNEDARGGTSEPASATVLLGGGVVANSRLRERLRAEGEAAGLTRVVPAARPVHRQRRDDRLPRRRPRGARRSVDVRHRGRPAAKVGAVSTVLVTGGAGFIGSHLADRLLAEGHRVISVDDLSTGRIANLAEARGYGKEFTFFNMDVRAEGLLPLFERHRPEVDLPPRGPIGRPPVPRRPRAGRQHQHHGHDQRARMRDEGRGAQGHLRGERRHDLRGATPAAGERVHGAGLPSDVARTGSRRRWSSTTSGSTSATAAWTTRRCALGQRLRAAAGPAWRGRRDRDLRPADAGERARDDLRRREPDPGLRVRRRRGARVRAVDGPRTRQAREHRDRTRGQREPRVPSARRHHRVRAGARLTARSRPGELRRIALDISSAPNAIAWKPWTHLEDGLAETVAFLKGI